MPDEGDEYAESLDEPHRAELRRFLAAKGHRLTHAGWEIRGNTTARLTAAFLDTGDLRKVIVKYVPFGFKESAEHAHHQRAWDECPESFRQHLVGQPQDPIMLSGGAWIFMQDLAANDLRAARSMSAVLREAMETGGSLEGIPAVVRAAVRTAALGWNDDKLRGGHVTAREFLEGLLEERLFGDHPLARWLRNRGLLDGTGSVPRAVIGPANPLALVLGEHPAAGRKLLAFHGRAHRDLHPGNLMLGRDLSRFWFVDLARYASPWPLTFDPVYLALTTAAEVLPALPTDLARRELVELLLSEETGQGAWLPQPVCALLDSIKDGARDSALLRGLAAEWHQATLLTFVATALIMCGRSAIGDGHKGWFFELAAEAARRYVGEAAPPIRAHDPATATGSTAPLRAVPETGRGTGGPPRVLAVDRASLEVRETTSVSRSRLLGMAITRRDRQARHAGHRQVLALTGEGGIGKSVLLGQCLDQLAEQEQAVVLVACGSVPPTADLNDLPAVDSALGTAANPTHRRHGLLRLLERQRVEHGSVTLLVDILDLVVSGRSAVGVGVLLAEALALGEVILTCRTLEFDEHLKSVPRLAQRVA